MSAEVFARYEELRRPTLDGLAARLRGRSIVFDAADLEDFYNEAWQALYLKLGDGDTVDNVAGFIGQVSFFRAIDEFRRLHPDKRARTEDVEGVVEIDVDERMDAESDLGAFVQALGEKLDDRERSAAVLCYLQGLSRPEAAAMMGLPEKRMQKLMDGVSLKLAPLLDAIRRGEWCESRDSLVRAYAIGLLDPDGERYKLAVAHLDVCSGCRRRVLGMRGIAALAPPLLLPWSMLSGAGATGAGTAGIASATSSSAAPVAAVAATVVAVIAGIAALASNDADPQPRPQAAATAAPTAAPTVAAPQPTAAGKEAKKESKPQRKARPRRTPAPAPTAAPTVAPTAPPAVTTAPPAPAATSPPAEPPPAPPVDDAGAEFGLP